MSYNSFVCICIPDEKEKYDPGTFADQIITGLNEAKGDLEQVGAIGLYLF